MRAVPDPRCGRETKHDHAEVLVCLIAGFLAGRTTLRRSLNWCRNNLEYLRECIPLKNGIASLSTASRILSGIDEELFALQFMEWVGEILDTKNRQLAIDGKALRGAAEKVKGSKVPMVLNAIDTVTGLVVCQFPIHDKGCEITAIPELLKLLDIRGSTITVDAIGTQTGIMEKNRDRYEYRWYSACTDSHVITKAQKEWGFIKTVGMARQVRIPIERDREGNDLTPDVETFVKNGSRRRPKPISGDSERNDIQETGMISDQECTAEEMGQRKRAHWLIENQLHHVLDESFREDRSPAKKSRNNLALVRKFAYNILRIAILSHSCGEIMTEAMDSFCDDPSLIRKYVFSGIKSFY